MVGSLLFRAWHVGSGGAPGFSELGTWAVVGPLLSWCQARGQWWGPCFLGAWHVGGGEAPAFTDLGSGQWWGPCFLGAWHVGGGEAPAFLELGLWAVVGPLLSWSLARGR